MLLQVKSITFKPAPNKLNKSFVLLSLFCGLIFIINPVKGEIPNQNTLTYQAAAYFSHLNWNQSLADKVSIKLSNIKNYSGIPFEDRHEKSDYFYYGKLPKIMNDIYADAFFASHYFEPKSANADYQVELILEKYKLPFSYQPDDDWWKKLQAQTDRWMQSASDTGIKLTIKLSSGNKKIKPWMESVEMMLSECDLNSQPQPQTWINNKNELIQTYLSTTPGQTFLAATNFLLLKTIQRINQEPLLAVVNEKFGDEIYLTSSNAYFTQGEVLDLYYNHETKGKSIIAAGQIQIIKALQNHATAYPVSLKSAHIKIGDWVEMQQTNHFEQPGSTYSSVKQCAKVEESEAIRITSN